MIMARAFSGKKKKEQLQIKRNKKRDKFEHEKLQDRNEQKKQQGFRQSDEEEEKSNEDQQHDIVQISEDDQVKDSPKSEVILTPQPSGFNGRGRKTNEFTKDLRTVFEMEDRDEIDRRKKDAHRPLSVEKRDKPWSILQEYLETTPIDIPKRPYSSDAHFSMSPEEADRREKKMFKEWLNGIYKKFPKERLNYFEHNLEVWRQLWRVCERSDIIALVTDARFPLFHFPQALYTYIIEDLKKPLVLVLNKQDLVEPHIVAAWKEYFSRNFPGLKTIAFNSFTSMVAQTAQEQSDLLKSNKEKKRKFVKRLRRYESAKGVGDLIEGIRSFHFENKKIDFDQVVNRNNEVLLKKPTEDDEDDEDEENEDEESDSEGESDPEEDDRQNPEDSEEFDRRITSNSSSSLMVVGTVGHPNVGKSSLINGLMGKKVVSASRTPGHTKHFQTIYLTKEIVLCDCPGLTFPALDRPKPLQILCGLFPIAQVREPFSAIRYLAERVPVEKIYNLKFPEDDDYKEWSPYVICEALAIKRGFRLAKSGRPDVHRAGLELLKEVFDGKVPISWPPPGIDLDKFQPTPVRNFYQTQQANKKEEATPEKNKGDVGSDEEDQEDEDEDEISDKKTLKKMKKKMKKRLELQKMQNDESSDDMEVDDSAIRAHVSAMSTSEKLLKKKKAKDPTPHVQPAITKKNRKKTEKAEAYQDRLQKNQKVRGAPSQKN
eukprot:TRINITY_DN490_c1_g1_i2.p1 TRINITY_DN490_c1_g1~~TRINITY_DN490_c1_g1_i2.p1  ORF type:complete len:713 (+),score=236.09 TRINITY_DN490_c1_g1_i2:74-2212(+)